MSAGASAGSEPAKLTVPAANCAHMGVDVAPAGRASSSQRARRGVDRTRRPKPDHGVRPRDKPWDVDGVESHPEHRLHESARCSAEVFAASPCIRASNPRRHPGGFAHLRTPPTTQPPRPQRSPGCRRHPQRRLRLRHRATAWWTNLVRSSPSCSSIGSRPHFRASSESLWQPCRLPASRSKGRPLAATGRCRQRNSDRERAAASPSPSAATSRAPRIAGR